MTLWQPRRFQTSHRKPFIHARRFTSLVTTSTLLISQLAIPLPADASHLGSTIASAGSAPPPAATLIENFQPDLFTGRATTAIPIVVPPSRKGPQPNDYELS